ncbi:MAG: PqqD family protein [Mucilaginibacter sp.]
MSTTVKLAETSLIQRNENKFLASALGEEIVMMNTDNGDYIGVNSVGSDIWNLLAEPMRIDELLAKIDEIYDVDAAQLKTELDEFVQRMLKLDMITVTNN